MRYAILVLICLFFSALPSLASDVVNTDDAVRPVVLEGIESDISQAPFLDPVELHMNEIDMEELELSAVPEPSQKMSLMSRAKEKVKTFGVKAKQSLKAAGKKTYVVAKKAATLVEPVEPLIRVTALVCVSTAQIAFLFL